MTLTARCPEDVLAMVPVVLGFVPSDSVVMLTFGARETFHARVDLPDPDDREAIEQICEALVEPARHNGVRRVLFVAYTADRRTGARLGRALKRRFGGASIEVLEMLRADGQRCYPLLGRRPGVPEWGVPYDSGHHRFTAEAVVHGRVTLDSREALAQTIAARSGRIAAVEDLMRSTPEPWPPGEIPPSSVILAEGRWVQSLLQVHLGEPNAITDEEVVRLLRGISLLRVRDAAWALVDRPSAEKHIAFWSDVVRRAPDAWVTPAATLLGWAAWQAGHGALAWCAVDRAVAGDRDYTLLLYLESVLENAVPPSVWTPSTDWDAGLRPSA